MNAQSSRHIFWGLLRLYSKPLSFLQGVGVVANKLRLTEWEHFELWLMLSLLVSYSVPFRVRSSIDLKSIGSIDLPDAYFSEQNSLVRHFALDAPIRLTLGAATWKTEG